MQNKQGTEDVRDWPENSGPRLSIHVDSELFIMSGLAMGVQSSQSTDASTKLTQVSFRV